MLSDIVKIVADTLGLYPQKKRRTDALETLLKPLREEEAERVEEAKQDAIALKRKMEADKRESLLRKMTPAERMKFQKKEEEKERKKMMKAQVKRQR
jgi:Mg/Co/Ni transporter MgtE